MNHPPVLAAYLIQPAGRDVVAWCRHCSLWHVHGAGDGHRVAHCPHHCSPYHPLGYVLREVGAFTRRVRARHHEELVEGTLRRQRTGRRCDCNLEPTIDEATTELEATDVDDLSTADTSAVPERVVGLDGSRASPDSSKLADETEARARCRGTTRRPSSQRDTRTRPAEIPAPERDDADATNRDATGGGPGSIETGIGAPLHLAPCSRENPTQSRKPPGRPR